jgi:exopolyphosphatase/guanosine-5'-triphosphate,3'-diphosphate pyrophosphatase
MGMSKAVSSAPARRPARRPSHLALVTAPASGAGATRSVAVIDLGSNSWRLVVYRVRADTTWQVVGQLSEPVRIAEGLARSGRLSRAAIARGVETLEVFSRYCEARGIARGSIDVVATSAVRDARNRDALLSAVRERTGLGVRVLSAEEEARYGYLAAVNSTTLRDGVVLDLGGGSLQLVSVLDRQAVGSASWPLGAVRITERFFADGGTVPRKQLERARATLRRELAAGALPEPAGGRAVAMGGAVRNLAAAVQRANGSASTGIQGFVLEADELRALLARLAKRRAAARALPGIKPARADLILAAAVVLDVVLDATGMSRLEVTGAGLREGVFLAEHLLPPEEPLLPDVRAAAIDNLLAGCDANSAHAHHVAALSLQLHDSLVRAKAIRPLPGERDLLWAAAMAHDVGMAVAYDGHAAHAHYLVLNAGLPGFTPRELAIVAQIVRYHRKGNPSLDELRGLAEKGDEKLVARCAMVLRVAEQLDRGEDGRIAGAAFAAAGRTLRLELDGDDSLARWSLARHLGDDQFRRTFGRRLDVSAPAGR